MRTLVYLIATTLDGFIADVGAGDPSGTVFALDGDHTAAQVEEYPQMLPFAARAFLGVPEDLPARRFDTVLEGRGSYEIGLAAGTPNAYPHLRHLVFSSTMTSIDDPGVELVGTDAVERVRALKAEEGRDIWLCGGGTLAGALRDEIDEIHLKINPVVLGDGIPLFGRTGGAVDDGPQIDRYRLRESRTFDSGVALLVYERRR